MDYCCITTSNRKDLVENLVLEIRKVFNGKILVIDDGSNPQPEFDYIANVQVVRYNKPHGKRKYFLLITDLFTILKHATFERFWLLPDDIRINPAIFSESVRLWNAIKDERKICLSVGHTHGRHYHSCWNSFKPVKMGAVVQTNWNDLCFMAERNFLEQLNYEIDQPLRGYDYRSSGVGRHITRTLHNKGWNSYHVDQSLCEFIDVPTVMHVKNQAV